MLSETKFRKIRKNNSVKNSINDEKYFFFFFFFAKQSKCIFCLYCLFKFLCKIVLSQGLKRKKIVHNCDFLLVIENVKNLFQFLK